MKLLTQSVLSRSFHQVIKRYEDFSNNQVVERYEDFSKNEALTQKLKCVMSTPRNESSRNRLKQFDFYFRVEIDSNRKSTIRIIQFRFESISIRNELNRNQCLSKKKIRVLF